MTGWSIESKSTESSVLRPSSEAHVVSPTFAGPLGGVKNLQVTDPTITSLRVRWEPAEGDVRTYNVFYNPAAGGAERVVRSLFPARFH